MRATGSPALPEAHRQLASLPHAVLLLEPGQSIASANPAAEQFLGQSLRRLAGRRLDSILTLADPRLLERIDDVETPVSAREIIVGIKDRGTRRIDINVAPMADWPGWQIMTIHDNTPTDAFGADSGRADHAALRGPEIMAHEIKNPLAGIRGAAQLLARRIDEKDRALTELITSEVDRIATLIDRIQHLSRKTPPVVQACNLHEAARRAIDVLRHGDLASDAPRIEEEFDPSLPAVLGSPDGLVQVMINLLANAREACADRPSGRVVVRTRFASGLQLHATGSERAVRLPVELRVSDDGPGVPPAMREHIFEPFVTTKKSGQGLGLPLVRKLVRDMNGRISHERDEVEGWTHFRVHLPLALEARSRASQKRKLGA
jgi:two-component system nitrogen regulation sensor histidine kinase GlnL